MERIASTLTVFFEAPFWVGVYERTVNGRLEVCKITFGAEPKDYNVYGFLLENWHRLRFSPPVEAEARQTSRINPKRMQREITRQLSQAGASTKAQQAMQLQHTEGKAARRKKTRLEREQAQAEQFNRKQQKKKQKHRGH